ncbi:MAG: flagellar type III secretion system pore protein FliP [Lachnospiraceae bacterium]
MKKYAKKICVLLLMVLIVFMVSGNTSYATGEGEPSAGEDDITQEGNNPNDVLDDNSLFGINISTLGETGGIASALQIVIILTIIALCPSILIMLTSFTRILVVMHFTRAALNTQTAPPNQILIGISLFLTFFIMAPVFENIYENAYVPLSKNEITQDEALDAAVEPLRDFMFKNVDDKDLDAMCSIAGLESVSSRDEVPTSVLIPSFIISELRVAFFIGFLVYIPFLVIDMVVASVLMSMGMMMLPPTTISMPFKILLFVLADGWNLIIVNLVQTINV